MCAKRAVSHFSVVGWGQGGRERSGWAGCPRAAPPHECSRGRAADSWPPRGKAETLWGFREWGREPSPPEKALPSSTKRTNRWHFVFVKYYWGTECPVLKASRGLHGGGGSYIGAQRRCCPLQVRAERLPSALVPLTHNLGTEGRGTPSTFHISIQYNSTSCSRPPSLLARQRLQRSSKLDPMPGVCTAPTATFWGLEAGRGSPTSALASRGS